MLRYSIFFLILFCPLICVADGVEDQFNLFLKSREVISQIYFMTSSDTLSVKARNELDAMASKLKTYNQESVLLRIEGFASTDGPTNDNVNLSMARALTVRNYIRENHDIILDVYLTGFGGVATADGESPEQSRRVDVAVYKSPIAAASLFDDTGVAEKIILK